MNRQDSLKQIASAMPAGPGVYTFLDEHHRVLYVGKAKNLRKRLASYFTGRHSGKTEILLRKASVIEHVSVATESEALLLENSLIKEQQPKYNILLKDDKSFPWICITNEPFPKIFSTRKVINDGSEYYGPYTSVTMVRTLLIMLRRIFNLRNCNLNLSQDYINKGKYKACLEYQIGNCKAPCIGLQSESDYNQTIEQVKHVLKGNIRSVTGYLKGRMDHYAAELKFEEAQKMKERIDILSRYQARSLVVSPKIGNTDVFGVSMERDFIAVNFMRVVEGAVVQTYTLGLKRQLDESRETLLSIAIGEIISKTGFLARQVIVPFSPDIVYKGSEFLMPQRGDKKKLLELAERNALWYRLEQKRLNAEKGPVKRTGTRLQSLRNDLRMTELPLYIECLDNSNIQGTSPVASCVVFRNGKPARSEYRHFNIKTVKGPDDYASMEEVVYRRYKRLIDENRELPQLVIIDGGKGQLSSALNSLTRLELANRVTVIGIAKRLEEIYFPGDSVPLYLDKKSVSLKTIQHIRNEAHRFGISFHRLKRSKKMISTSLDNIKGIGVVSRQELLMAFKSPEAIAAAGIGELAEVVGNNKAAIIFNHFHGTNVPHGT